VQSNIKGLIAPWPQLRILFFCSGSKVYSYQLSVILQIIRGRIRNYSKGSNNGYISRVDLSTRKKYFYTSSLFPKTKAVHSQVLYPVGYLPITLFKIHWISENILRSCGRVFCPSMNKCSIDWLAGWGDRKLDGDF
jgi:hypothetical protein